MTRHDATGNSTERFQNYVLLELETFTIQMPNVTHGPWTLRTRKLARNTIVNVTKKTMENKVCGIRSFKTNSDNRVKHMSTTLKGTQYKSFLSISTPAMMIAKLLVSET